MIKCLRSIAFDIFFYSFTAVYILFFLPFVIVAPHQFAFILFRTWTKICFFMLSLIVGLKYTIRNRHYLDAITQQGPCLIACKHQSAFDTILISLFVKDIVIILKGQLALIPIFGYYLKKLGSVFIDRENKLSSIRDLLQKSRDAISAGRSLFIFPEGTRSRPGEANPYQRGIGLLYKDLSIPVVPVALNTGVFWGRKSFIKQPGHIIIDILPPIMPGLERDQFLDTMQNVIETASLKLLEEPQKPKIFFKRIITGLVTVIVGLSIAAYSSMHYMIRHRLNNEGITFENGELHIGFTHLPYYTLTNVKAQSISVPDSYATIEKLILTPTAPRKLTAEAINVRATIVGKVNFTMPTIEAFIEQSTKSKKIPFFSINDLQMQVDQLNVNLKNINGSYQNKPHMLNFSLTTSRSASQDLPLVFIKCALEKHNHLLKGKIDFQSTFAHDLINAMAGAQFFDNTKKAELIALIKDIPYEKNQKLKQMEIVIGD